MTVRLENRKCWMANRMDWLENKPGRSVNNLEKSVSTDWWGNMREMLENMPDSKLRRFATESSVVKLASSSEMLESTAVTSGCNSDLLANTEDLWENRLDWSENSWGSSVSRPERHLLETQQHSWGCSVSMKEMR